MIPPTAPAVSVVVVTHDSEPHLEACLDALGAAAGTRGYELVVVDNGSSDDGVQVLARRWPEAALLRRSNQGFASAVNHALPSCRGDAVLLLNPDATMQPGSLELLCAELADGDARLAACGPRLEHTDGSDQVSARPRPSLRSIAFEAFMVYHLWPHSSWYRADASETSSIDVPCLSGACLLIRRAALESIGGLDETFFLYGEDLDLFVRLGQAGWRCRYVPAARVTHEVGGSAFRDRQAFFVHLHRSQAQLIDKHFRGARRIAARLLHASGIALRVVAYALHGALGGGRERRERARHHAAALRAVLG